jgi:hemolysin activation/secretion protein
MKEITQRRFALIIILSASLFANSFAQKTETRIIFNSGLFSFSGQSAEGATFVNYNATTKSGYTNNSYGSNKALCYGFSLQRNHITSWNFIFGFDLGYELLRSKILIDEVADYDGTSNINYPATGKAFLNFGFLNFFPHVGFRIKAKNISFDITGGFELALKLKSWESGGAKASDGTEIVTSTNNAHSNLFDFRRRIQLAVNYKRISPYIGYSVGLVNYSNSSGGANDAFARMLRIGIAYKLN